MGKKTVPDTDGAEGVLSKLQCAEDTRGRHWVGLEEELQEAQHVRDRNGYCPAICLQVRDVETETQKEEVLILPLGPNIRTKWRRKW